LERKELQLVEVEHTPGESGRKLVEQIYPLVAEGIANGLFIPEPRKHAVLLLPLCARMRSRIWRRYRLRNAPPGTVGARLHPLVAECIAGGLCLPNRSSSVCSRRYCAFANACEREFGGTIAA
jgi:hypothetical protein